MKLTKLIESNDVEAYLTTFERMMETYQVEKAKWAYLLAPQLTDKAQQAYAAMAIQEAGEYENSKEPSSSTTTSVRRVTGEVQSCLLQGRGILQ